MPQQSEKSEFKNDREHWDQLQLQMSWDQKTLSDLEEHYLDRYGSEPEREV